MRKPGLTQGGAWKGRGEARTRVTAGRSCQAAATQAALFVASPPLPAVPPTPPTPPTHRPQEFYLQRLRADRLKFSGVCTAGGPLAVRAVQRSHVLLLAGNCFQPCCQGCAQQGLAGAKRRPLH